MRTCTAIHKQVRSSCQCSHEDVQLQMHLYMHVGSNKRAWTNALFSEHSCAWNVHRPCIYNCLYISAPFCIYVFIRMHPHDIYWYVTVHVHLGRGAFLATNVSQSLGWPLFTLCLFSHILMSLWVTLHVLLCDCDSKELLGWPRKLLYKERNNHSRLRLFCTKNAL